jgi:hypothetical protein
VVTAAARAGSFSLPQPMTGGREIDDEHAGAPSATVSMPIPVPPLVAGSPLRYTAYWSCEAGARTTSSPVLYTLPVAR